MVRRRSTKGREGRSKPKPLKRADGKIKKWNTIADIPMDGEDQCACCHFQICRKTYLTALFAVHHSKDQILLDGDRGGRGEDDEDDEEVFALKGLDDDSEDEEEYNNQDDDDVDDEEALEDDVPTSKKKKSTKSKKGKGKAVEDENSDEEEEEEGWGRGRAAYYASNADQLESDDEEGNELEEQEAKRLQSKMREEMQDDDFGLNDNPELDEKMEVE